MEKSTYVIGHRSPDADSICSAIAYAHLRNCLGHLAVRPARAGEIDAETAFVLRYFDVPVPELVIDAAGLDLILVDHNETGQALPNIERANILEIWEHHRIGDLRLPKPIVFHCEPVGATATLIGEQYFAHGVMPTRAMAGVMIAAILSDTVLFRSPTTSDKDHAMASRLQPFAGIELHSFGQQLRQIKTTAVEGKSPVKIVRDDFKEFQFGGHRVGIAQVEVLRPGAFAGRIQDILSEMHAVRETQGLAQVILMITDVEAEASDLWVVGDRVDLFEQAFGTAEDGMIHLPGCMSRKKQVVPRLEAVFAAEEELHQQHTNPR
ncbi:MAG: manganese-dependent inorganic pyrophosphatase [Gammaproteobacteria bacterium]|nr:manganese-dependent inorganic pyrophosphatase [Gammaproteobacteria bacterium]